MTAMKNRINYKTGITTQVCELIISTSHVYLYFELVDFNTLKMDMEVYYHLTLHSLKLSEVILVNTVSLLGK
jgi:hypothetical protein